MSLRFALLGLLSEQPASGYELTGKFERTLKRYAWHAQHSQIYPELNRLADEGLIQVIEEGARGRRTYAILEKGRAALRHWLINPPSDFVVRNEFVLRLFLLSTLDADGARALLRGVVEESTRQREALQAAVDHVERAKALDAPSPFNRLVAEFGLRSFQTIHDWAVWALDQIAPKHGAGKSQSKPRTARPATGRSKKQRQRRLK
jgi:DNA-binding PadR family transcriptional regulator